MRKLILLAATAALALPSAAMAQRYHDGDRHRDRVEMRHDRRDVRHDRRDIRRDRSDFRHDRSDFRQYRRDSRYDRGDYRHEYRRDRDRRHVAYVAPYRNWNYRPVTIGYRLSPVFYSPRYYITDYGFYHLRMPPPWERWIRYGDDLLLVNLRTGRVLEVIHYRYW